MTILKELEESAAEVQNPNAYVAVAVRNSLATANGRGGRSDEEPEADARHSRPMRQPAVVVPPTVRQALPRQAPVEETNAVKVEKRVAWLNAHGGLAASLNYDVLGELMMSLDYQDVMQVLTRLQESSAQVRDPTAYVVTALRRLSAPPPADEGGGQVEDDEFVH